MDIKPAFYHSDLQTVLAMIASCLCNLVVHPQPQPNASRAFEIPSRYPTVENVVPARWVGEQSRKYAWSCHSSDWSCLWCNIFYWNKWRHPVREFWKRIHCIHLKTFHCDAPIDFIHYRLIVILGSIVPGMKDQKKFCEYLKIATIEKMFLNNTRFRNVFLRGHNSDFFFQNSLLIKIIFIPSHCSSELRQKAKMLNTCVFSQ